MLLLRTKKLRTRRMRVSEPSKLKSCGIEYFSQVEFKDLQLSELTLKAINELGF